MPRRQHYSGSRVLWDASQQRWLGRAVIGTGQLSLCSFSIVSHADAEQKAHDVVDEFRLFYDSCAGDVEQLRSWAKAKLQDRRDQRTNAVIDHGDYVEILFAEHSGQSHSTLIDHDDLEKLPQPLRVYRHGRGYAMVFHPRRADGTIPRPRVELLHRFVLGYRGPLEIDHKNGRRLDNRRSNLRIVTTAQNAQNGKLNALGKFSSGFRGVSFDKFRNLWAAYCTLNQKMHRLGRFTTEDEAAVAAYDLRRILMPFSIEDPIILVGGKAIVVTPDVRRRFMVRLRHAVKNGLV